ncbi:PTS transporter subunit EIIC [Allocoprobacillus halotolerans]|uniref:PTS transporter subunit EIIC n=1 Tax=Allocoprobacillus halotolerans TaxID=2944914 RepID=A0ABY5I303_9FIRM|nr:PTS transporter subunit EIIC [Allocoprobacillus halotolerans]UTY39746.1 PTS transporter subunit EIIC [Allocoprobacillus halotolerans]
MSDYIHRLSENIYFQSIKLTYADFVPYMICMGILYFIQKIFNLPFINLFMMMVAFLYCVFINVFYTIHYTRLRNMTVSQNVLMTLLLCFMVIYSHSMEDTLQYTFPLFICNMLILECLYRIVHWQIKISFLPTILTQYFIQLIPFFVAFILVSICVYLQNFYMPYLIYVFYFFMNFVSSLAGVLLIVFITCYFWYTGIHAVSILGAIIRPFWMQMIMINFMCLLNGQTPHYIGVEGFYQWFVWIGGSGTTLGLTLLCRFFAKSHTLKKLGNDSFQGSLLNVNEPILFGVPVVENHYMKIPFFVTPLLCALVTYLLMAQGYLHYSVLIAPWVLPSIIGGLWATDGHMITIIYIIGLIILSLLSYLPFFLKYDQYLKVEEEIS